MLKNYLLTTLSLLIFFSAQAQVGSEKAFRFIDNPAVSRTTALGGVANHIYDDDLGLAYGNPALLNAKMDNQAVFSFNSFLAGSGIGFFSYAREIKDLGMLAVNVQYMNYGEFIERDITGMQIGTFKANETALNVAGSRQVGERLYAGAQIKFLFSNLEQYSAFGLGADLGLTYHIEEENLTASLVFKNMGAQLTSYYDGSERNNLPFNIQFGVSKKMKHAPFRLGVIFDNLQTWDLTYTDPNLVGKRDPLTGEPIEIEESTFGDKLMRHIIFQGEIVAGDAIKIQLAYNYRRRQELKISENPGLAGLSFGLGVGIKAFDISYGLANFTRAGTSHHFTLAMRFSEMGSKKALN